MNQNYPSGVVTNRPLLNRFTMKALMATIVLSLCLAHNPAHAQQTVSSGNTVSPTASNITVYGQGNNILSPNNADVTGNNNTVDALSPYAVVTGDNNTMTFTGIATMPPGVSGTPYTQGGDNVLVGHQSSLNGANSILIGDSASSVGLDSITLGSFSNTYANSATCIGVGTICGSNQPNPNISTQTVGGQTVVGSGSSGVASNTSVFGSNASASAMFGVAVGYNANADYTNCIALESTCDRVNSVSFGNRQLTQLAYGVNQFDGVAVGQLYGFASGFGGGSNFNNGIFTAPNYLLGSNNFYNVGDALQYLYSLDGQQGTGGTGTVSGGQNIVTSTNGSNTTVSTTSNPSFNSVTTTDVQGNTTVQNGSGVTVTSANGNQVSLTTSGLNNGGNVINGVGAGQVSAGSTQAVNGSQLYQVQQDSLEYNSNTQTYDATRSGSATRISGVAPGVNPTDAVNLGQLNSVKNWAKSYVDGQIGHLNDKLNAVGAMNSATSNAASSFAGVDTTKKNLVAIGFGEQGGRVADAIMYQHRNENGYSAWNASVSFSQGGGTSVGVGYAIGW